MHIMYVCVIVISPRVSDAVSPETNHHSRRHERADQSPKSESSVKSPGRQSPSPSQSSSQNLSVGRTSSLSAARWKKDTPQLTPSLSNYYKEKLIEHVSGWPGDQLDRQANLYAEEAHTVGSLHCSQVSVELKRGRSLVRINEIQTTLEEQRILFLRQQIRELENVRNQTSFMPTHPPPQT